MVIVRLVQVLARKPCFLIGTFQASVASFFMSLIRL